MSLPSKSEVMGWNSGNLADYLKKMKLVGCDRVVRKNNISGAGFLNMTDKDLKNFPTVHIPFISKIRKDINQNNKGKKSLFNRSNHQQPQNQEPNPGVWDSDEFDQEESDNDYEEPDDNQFDDNYICTASFDFEENANDDDDEYETPPSDKCSELPAHFRPAKPLGDGDYLDSGPRGSARPPKDYKSASLPSAVMNIPKPPSRPDPSPHRPIVNQNQSKHGPVVPVVDRSKKPGPSKKDTAKSKNIKLPMTPKSATLPAQSLQHRFNTQQIDYLPPPLEQANVTMAQDMDPQWYVGQISRGEAEVSLRKVKKDGAFLVRDSSKGCTEQPYTLMVLYQQKVYNIQIRFLGNMDGYSLGTGLNGTENFSTVMEMVTHHRKTPLILIDGLERGAGPQRQCCLIYPAAF